MTSVWLGTKRNVYLNSFCFGFRPILDVDPYFIANLLRSPYFRKDIRVLAQGISRYNISKGKVMELSLKLPEKVEQGSIGKLLRELDNLITLHQRKISWLESIRQTLLIKFFTKDGTIIPELRFKGFNEVWEQRKLEDLFINSGSGGTPKSTNPDYYHGNIPFLSISDVSNSNGIINKTEKYITEEGLNNSSAWIVPKGSISLAMYASVGKIAILNRDVATSQAFFNMVFNENSLRNFIYYRLDKASSSGEWNPLISTGTQANLNAKKVKDFNIQVPSLEEQTAIGNFFQCLDRLITLLQQKIDKLTNVKKLYLRKLLI